MQELVKSFTKLQRISSSFLDILHAINDPAGERNMAMFLRSWEERSKCKSEGIP